VSPSPRKLRLAFVMLAALVLSGATTASAAPPPVRIRLPEQVQFVPEPPEVGIAPHVLVSVAAKCDPQLTAAVIDVFTSQPGVIFSHDDTGVFPCTGRWETIVVKNDGEFHFGKATVTAFELSSLDPAEHRQVHLVP
jgi:hypothetical protein